MNRHNLPLAWHAAMDMSAIGWVMIAYRSNCVISPGWLASIAEGDSIINATLLYFFLRWKTYTGLLVIRVGLCFYLQYCFVRITHHTLEYIQVSDPMSLQSCFMHVYAKWKSTFYQSN